MNRVGIALGSNLGDRRELLCSAREYLKEMNLAGEPFLQSSLYSTEPLGCPDGSQPYLNAVVELMWAGTAEDLLLHCQWIERELGRVRTHVRCEPRTADVDLIYVGDKIIHSPHLIVPHPRAHLRKFVLKPLSDIRPDLVLPGQKQTVQELLESLDSDEPDPFLYQTEW